ncbi:hypothetical protein [Kordia jejudonensis]|uniref:hypothetical protein n=1 Tax=Kordia jejudonensis TaxID=1348245 RepID=UPI0006298C19|nr:hypothetical protein [Kordia jejudonensis]
MKIRKLKAGSLQFAILISAIIAVLLSVFVILVNAHTLFSKKSDLLIETVQQADNTIRYSLQNFTTKRDTSFLVLNEAKNITSSFHTSYWGMFGKVYAESKARSKTVEKIALVSGWQTVADRTGLYLKETNTPLIVVGNTKVEGKVYLPKRGVRSGTISGNSYHGNQLIYGNRLRSDTILPKLPTKLLNHLEFLQKMPLPVSNEDYIDISRSKIHINSFSKAVKTLYAREVLNISNVQLTGNIMVRSDTKITVAASSSLKDVILIAPIIEIEAHTKGVFQAIASKKILVGKNTELAYPSVLLINAEDTTKPVLNNTESKQIFIDENSIVKGMICYLQDRTTDRFTPQLIFSKNTEVYGIVYCEQQLELLGSIYGSIYTSGFITKQSGSVYQNHIYNGTISSSELMDEYVGFPFENLDYKVAKWLY